jgi:hypothetical protein
VKNKWVMNVKADEGKRDEVRRSGMMEEFVRFL